MITYLRESKFGKIEVLEDGLVYVLLDGKKLACSFYETDRAVKFAGNDRLIAQCIQRAKNTSFGDYIMGYKV